MKRTLLTLIIIVLTSCSAYDENISINNAEKSQTITLKNQNNKNVYAISIKITGHIEGKARIQLILNNKPYKTENINGSVNFKWGGDWYSNEAVIIYKTTKVIKGNLSIDYTFDTF